MPLSTVIPAQSLEWVTRVYGPARFFSPSGAAGQASGVVAFLDFRPPHSAHVTPSTQNAGGEVSTYAETSIPGSVIRRFAQRHGRRCCEVGVTAANVNAGAVSEAWRPPDWRPSFGPAANMSPGAMLDPGEVVAVFDWNVSLGLAGAAPAWPNDRSGVYFLPASGSTSGNTSQRGGSSPLGGFAVYANTVGGVAAFEYVAWTTAGPGTVIERVTIGASIVPSVSLWNTFRFILVGAASGREARLTLQANGFDIVVDRLFDNVQLQRPATAAPASGGATGMISGVGVATTGAPTTGDTIFHTLTYKAGRFLPSGRQMQDT